MIGVLAAGRKNQKRGKYNDCFVHGSQVRLSVKV
jgi:hypothetical protein